MDAHESRTSNLATFAESAGAVTAYLEWIGTDAAKPAVFPLHDEAVIGRDPQDALASDKYICIPEQTISRRHARIRRRGASLFRRRPAFAQRHLRARRAARARRLASAARRRRAGAGVGAAGVPFAGGAPSAAARRPSSPRRSTPPSSRRPLRRRRQAEPQRPRKDRAPPARDGAGQHRAGRRDRPRDPDRKDHELHLRAVPAGRARLHHAAATTSATRPRRSPRGAATAPSKTRQQVRISHTIVDEVLHKKRAILSVDTLSDRHFAAHESIVAQAILSVMCVPLILGDEVLGLIQVDTSSDPYAFQEADLEILSGVCAETAVALKNFQLYSDIKGLLDGFVCASVQAIEERDPVTAGHSFRVAGYAESLAMRARARRTTPTLRRAAFTQGPAARDPLRRAAARLRQGRRARARLAQGEKAAPRRHAPARTALPLRARLPRAASLARPGRAAPAGASWSMAAFRQRARPHRSRACASKARGSMNSSTSSSRANEPAISH